MALLVIVLAGACGGRPREAQVFRVEIDTTGSYPVIRSLGPAREWIATPVAAISTIDSGPTELAAVRSVLLDRDGSVYVIDPTTRAIGVFDSTGRFLRQLGREGAGPTEYRDPYSLAWLGDTLALLDPGNGRIGLLDRSGAWLGSWLSPRVSGDQRVRLYRTPPDGFWSYDVRPGPQGPETIFVHYGSLGPDDTLPSLPRDPTLTPVATCHRPDGGLSSFLAPLSPQLLAVPTPARELAVARTSEYRVAFIGRQGDTLRVIERPHDPVSLSDREWTEATAPWRKFRAEWPQARCDRDDFERPDTKPPLNALVFDAQGRLWAEVVTDDGTIYDVYSPGTGQLLFTVRGLPPSRGLDPSLTETRAAIVTRDSLDVPQVRLHRLEPPSR